MELPLLHRGEGYYKKLQPGLNLPCWFIDGCRSLDSRLFFIFHPYKVLYDDIINQYTGSIENPRFVIGRQDSYGDQLLFGWVLTDGQGRPKQDNTWHMWRLCADAGWAHIIDLKSTDGEYLRIALDRLHLQAQIQEKHGNIAWNKYLRNEDEAIRNYKEKQMKNIFEDRTAENRFFMRKAYENFLNKKVTATNPTREIITSFSNQTNKSRIIRPLTDREGGIV